jgi:hypothetical protein
LCSSVLLRGSGLTVGCRDGAAYYSGAREDDLCYYAVGLGRLVEGFAQVGRVCTIVISGSVGGQSRLLLASGVQLESVSICEVLLLLWSTTEASPEFLNRLPRFRTVSALARDTPSLNQSHSDRKAGSSQASHER